MRLNQAQILEALAEYVVRHKLVKPGSLVDFRLKLVDSKGETLSIMLIFDESDPEFVADVKDYGVPKD